MTNWKKVVSTISAVAIAILLVAIFFSLGEGQVDAPCDRLDPCCYGQGEPDKITHLATGEVWKYWEKVDRNNESLPGLFQLWHYNANDTSLFYDNTTKHTLTAQTLDHLRYYVAQQRDLGFISKEGFCWLDRMVEYLE